VGNADHPVAGYLERGVADAIGLEGRSALVEGPAVELHDQPAVGPDEVDLEAGHIDIDRRPRKARFPANVEEVSLEVRARGRCLELLDEEAA
jgi:hypothetical protein